jgi:hypothetical protein
MGPCVTILMVPRVADVEINQFWMENLTKVLSPSFRIAYVPRIKKMKTERTKNKIFKPQKPKRYLTLNYINGVMALNSSCTGFIFSKLQVEDMVCKERR